MASAGQLSTTLQGIIQLSEGANDHPTIEDDNAPFARELDSEDVGALVPYLWVAGMASGFLLRSARNLAAGVVRALEEPMLEDSAIACARGCLEAATKAWYLIQPQTDPIVKAMRAGHLFVGELHTGSAATGRSPWSDEEDHAEEAQRYYSQLCAEAKRRGYSTPNAWNTTNQAMRMLRVSSGYGAMSRAVHGSLALAIADAGMLGSDRRSYRATTASAYAAVAFFIAVGRHAKYTGRYVDADGLADEVLELIPAFIFRREAGKSATNSIQEAQDLVARHWPSGRDQEDSRN